MLIKDMGVWDNFWKAEVSHTVVGSVVGGSPSTTIVPVSASTRFLLLSLEVTGNAATADGYAQVQMVYVTPSSQVVTMELRPFLHGPASRPNFAYFQIPEGTGLEAGAGTNIIITVSAAAGQTWNGVRVLLTYFSYKVV